MTRKEAQFILASFRANGQETEDPLFAEALQFALRDRELGAWLTSQRALDAAFSDALSAILVPAEPRKHARAWERGEGPDLTDLDHDFTQALAAIEAPPGLQEEVLLGMAAGTQSGRPQASSTSRSARSLFPFLLLAAAAVITFTFWYPSTVEAPTNLDSEKGLRMTYARAKMDTLTALTLVGASQPTSRGPEMSPVLTWQQQEEIPETHSLPRLLHGASVVRCETIEVDGREGCLLCYKTTQWGMVHLVVFGLQAGECQCHSIPTLTGAPESCYQCEVSGLSVAEWKSGQRGYILLGRMESKELREFF